MDYNMIVRSIEQASFIVHLQERARIFRYFLTYKENTFMEHLKDALYYFKYNKNDIDH